MSRLRVFFDGGCRPNPGVMEVGCVARGIANVERDVGMGSSQEAEWLALLHAVRVAIGLGAKDVELIGDSVAVLRVARGEAKVRAGDVAHLAQFHVLTAAITTVRLRHIARSKNLAGIALAKGHPR